MPERMHGAARLAIRSIGAALALGCALHGARAQTADEEPAAPPDAPAAATEDAGMLERTRDKVRAVTEAAARGVDSWFGDKPFDRSGRVSDGRIGLRTFWRADEGFDVAVRFDARFDLPNLRERAYLFVGRDNQREVVTDRPDAFSRQEKLLAETATENQSFFAGLGLQLREAIELRAGIHRGYRPYAQARYRRPWTLSERDRMEFRETLFLTVADGFGSTTTLSVEHAYSPALLLRWLNAATLSRKTDGVAWSSGLGLFRGFGVDRVLSVEALIGGETGRDVDVSEYGVRAKWQQPVYRDWLIGEFIVGHFWPRKDALSPRDSTWAFGIGALMRF